MSAYARRGWPKGSFNIAVGSDSRLTADGDLLDEMRFALEGMAKHGANCDAYCILEAVSTRAAAILNLTDIGHLKPDARADWLVWTQGISFERADLALVVCDGIPRIGDPDIMAKFPHVQTVAATLDGVEKRIHLDLARQIHRCQLKEPGLEVDALPTKRFYLF